MREDTFQKRLEDMKRVRSIPYGRDAGDHLHPPGVIANMKERIPIRLSWMSGSGWDERKNHKTYSAPRYYHFTITPDDVDADSPRWEHSLLATISKHDLSVWCGMSFPEQNMLLEEWWYRHGGD